MLYLNQITFPIENYQIVPLLCKTNPNEGKKFYNIDSLVRYKSNQTPEFFGKISKTVQSIALCATPIYDDCYKYLFQLLLKHPTFKEKEIQEFKALFEKASMKKKKIVFSYWWVITFPKVPIDFFLKYAIEHLKEELFQCPTLKKFYEKT